jgi:hypothetical protein
MVTYMLACSVLGPCQDITEVIQKRSLTVDEFVELQNFVEAGIPAHLHQTASSFAKLLRHLRVAEASVRRRAEAISRLDQLAQLRNEVYQLKKSVTTIDQSASKTTVPHRALRNELEIISIALESIIRIKIPSNPAGDVSTTESRAVDRATRALVSESEALGALIRRVVGATSENQGETDDGSFDLEREYQQLKDLGVGGQLEDIFSQRLCDIQKRLHWKLFKYMEAKGIDGSIIKLWVKDVANDGNCFYESIAWIVGKTGAALRLQIKDFMDARLYTATSSWMAVECMLMANSAEWVG